MHVLKINLLSKTPDVITYSVTAIPKAGFVESSFSVNVYREFKPEIEKAIEDGSLAMPFIRKTVDGKNDRFYTTPRYVEFEGMVQSKKSVYNRTVVDMSKLSHDDNADLMTQIVVKDKYIEFGK